MGHDTTNMNRKETKALFDQYKQEGRIDFVTFHQSYGYEEFVEGIKPEMDSEQETSNVRYKIESGIFKTLRQKSHSSKCVAFVLAGGWFTDPPASGK